jgi:hypothetical protein
MQCYFGDLDKKACDACISKKWWLFFGFFLIVSLSVSTGFRRSFDCVKNKELGLSCFE